MPPISPQLTLSAPSNAQSGGTVTPTAIFGNTPTINFQSPGSTGGNTSATSQPTSSASSGSLLSGFNPGEIVQLGFFALLFIFVVRELNQ